MAMDQNHIAFVISDVARLYRRRFDERTRSFGITGPQMRALVQIMRFSPASIRAHWPTGWTSNPSPPAAWSTGWSRADLVERSAAIPQDRRAWQLFLTSTAEPIARELQTIGQGFAQ